jgi:hypothetical protein
MSADELQALIDSNVPNEHECRYYLQFTRHILMPWPIINFRRVETERVGNLGRSDYVISGTVYHQTDQCVRAYIWELKAPQCYLFEEDIANRLKPSSELIDAENKLLNYYYENKNNGLFHQQYELTHPGGENVLLGGIIIGCERTKVNSNQTAAEKITKYKTAEIARNFMYGPAGIKIKTWDEVVHQIRISETRDRQFTQPQIEIPVTALSPGTLSTSVP